MNPSAELRISTRTRLRSRRGGFTLIEILIATAIMTIGMIGILALFPVAIRAGRHVIEDSNAVVIAQSVAEGIRSGVRNRKGFTEKGNPFFVFSHDGVTDPIPPDPARAAKGTAKDYFILLPRFRDGASFSGRTARTRRRAALKRAPTFVYPESDARANGGGDPQRADNDGNDEKYSIDTDADGEPDRRIEDIRVEKVYRLGNHLVPGHTPKRKPDGSVDYSPRVLSDERAILDMVRDNLSQYSYAFKIRPSYFDADLSASGAYQPAGRLFHVTVMVFRNFQKPTKDEPSPHLDQMRMVYSLDFEVAI